MTIPPNLRALATALLGLALAVATPACASPGAVLGYDDARHLLARTGFGPTQAEVDAYATMSREAAVAHLLREARTATVTSPPASALETGSLRVPSGDGAANVERRAFLRRQVREGLELRAWWTREMLVTPSPLTERMTLFWHNHFVSAQAKVLVARLMYRQNVTLRANALGNFATMLHALARDPAMVIYLDAARNRKGMPNENFAREVMELFTLGEGRYTEQDVKEAARAFTGWSLDRDTGEFTFRRALHDGSEKTVLGSSGRFDGDAVLDLLLARPETAQHIVAKLWREFVSPDPDPRETARIARRFRESNYDIRAALALILTSDAFYAPGNRGVLVKSPVDLVVGTLRQLEVTPAEALPFAIAAAGMGQNLFAPPNVKGWPGGEAWINTTSLLARKQFLARLTRADETASMSAVEDAMPPAPGTDDEKARQQRFRRAMERGLATAHFDSAAWLAALPGAAPAARARSAQRLLLATAPLQAPDPEADALTLVRGLVQDAAYQLK